MRSTLPDNFPRRQLILDLAAKLAEHPAVERVWLFGSRARGEAFERSDIDFAIEAPEVDHYDWLRIKLEFEDKAPTLLNIDLLRWEETPEDLRQRIRREGIVVHERAVAH